LFRSTYNDLIWYNFSSPVAVSSVANFTFWVRTTDVTNDLVVQIYYNDGSNSGAITFNLVTVNVWVNFEFLSVGTYTEGKFISAIKFSFSAYSQPKYLDDVFMYSTVQGESSISSTSYPWYGISTASNFVTTVSHSGNVSYAFSSSASDTMSFLKQKFNYIPTNNITEFSVWVCSSSTSVSRFVMQIIYSDGTFYSENRQFTSYQQWSKLNFTNMLYTNKYITYISFYVSVTIGFVWVDDISLLVSVPISNQVFTWGLTPLPLQYNNENPIDYLTYSDNDGFTQYVGVQEYFNGYIILNNIVSNENGTFYALSAIGSLTGNITLGNFNFIITARTYTTNTTELLTIQMYLTDRSLIVSITMHWLVITVTPDVDFGTTTPLIPINMMGGMVLLIVFALVFGYYAGKDGLLVGIILAIFINSISGLFPSYGLIIAVIIGAILIVSHTGIPKSDSGTG
jgi:hypothetical protein